MNRKQMITKAKSIIKSLEKKGLDIGFALQGKTVDQVAHNKKTFTNFLKFVDRAKEKPKIEKEVKKYHDKLIVKQQKQATKKVKQQIKIEQTSQKPNQITNNRIGNVLKFNFNKENNSINAKMKTLEESSKFLNTYFKGVKDHAKVQKRIEIIQKRLGTRLDLFYDMVDQFSNAEYKYKYKKEYMQNHMTDEYEKGIINRLDDIEDILNEYGL